VIAEGCSGSWYTDWSAATRRAAVARGSPVPGFRAYLGKEPLATWTRIPWPAANRYAVGQRRTVAAVT
jgi:hypothetical protein